jgi:Uncharacterised protein family (UPF0158)
VLEVGQVDLADLAMALEDHSAEHSWWLDPSTGEVDPFFSNSPAEGENGAAAALIPIRPLPTSVGYQDMEDFVSCVRDPRARDLLERAIAGRGAFRRFKDTLLGYPDLRRSWFVFHDARGERRAIEWLADRELLEAAAATTRIAELSDSAATELPGLVDASGVTRRVTDELRRIYRKRLEAVILVGPWARGGVHHDAAVTLAVVLEGMTDRWEEKRRMERVLWRHSVRHDAVIVGIPLSAEDLEMPVAPWLAQALDEGVRFS